MICECHLSMNANYQCWLCLLLSTIKPVGHAAYIVKYEGDPSVGFFPFFAPSTVDLFAPTRHIYTL